MTGASERERERERRKRKKEGEVRVAGRNQEMSNKEMTKRENDAKCK